MVTLRNRKYFCKTSHNIITFQKKSLKTNNPNNKAYAVICSNLSLIFLLLRFSFKCQAWIRTMELKEAGNYYFFCVRVNCFSIACEFPFYSV